MARFTVTENVETTYEVNIDSEDYEYVEAWRNGTVVDEDFHDFLAAFSPTELSVTERVIEEV